MQALSDDEVLDFVASGSVRAFTVLCLRKLPWLTVLAAQSHGDTERALACAAQAMLRTWEDAPLWPPRSGRLDHRLIDLLEAGAVLAPRQDGPHPIVSEEQIARLLRQLVAECRRRPQRRHGMWQRLWMLLRG